MLISIIIPIYKVEPFIVRCIDSVLHQTYRDIEIILVDDGSPDNCGKICDEYAIKDSRIVVIHKENGGLSSARNAALDICKGEYIMFVDSDDYVEPDFCEIALKTLNEKKVSCVSFGYYEFRNNQRTRYVTSQPRVLNAEEAIKQLIIRTDVVYNLAWNKIYHRSLFETIRYPHGKLYEDNGTTYKLFHLAGRIYVTDIPLYNYIRRDESITGQAYSSRAITDKFDLWYARLLFLYAHYPNLTKAAHQQLLELVQLGFVTLPWTSSQSLIEKFKQYLDTYKKDIINFKLNGRLISLYYYCYPLFYLRVSTYKFVH